MSCDEIKVFDETNEITLINHENKVDVISQETETVIVDNVEIIKAEEEATKIIINASDVIFSRSENIDIDMNCTANEQIGDAVYVIGDGEVRRANNSDISTAKVMGFIASKAADTTCKVRVVGIIDLFTGLTPGGEYFLNSVDGDIDTIAPTSSGSVLVRVGQAIEDDKFLIRISNNYIIRN